MGKKLAVAFAGAGDVERENVFALLDDQLTAWDETYDEVVFVLPEKVKRGDKALKHVLAFLEDDEVGLTEEDYDEQVAFVGEAEDVVLPGLVNVEADDKILIVAPKLDEDGSADDLTEKLMEDAAGYEVPVKDLTHSLDDLMFDEEDDAPTEEEEAQEEPETASKRPEIDEGRQETLDDLKALRERAEAQKDGAHPNDETPEETAEGFVRNRDEAQAQTHELVQEAAELVPHSATELTLLKALKGLVAMEVTRQLAAIQAAKVEAEAAEQAAAEDDSEELVEVYKGDEGIRKKGRGRPRKGEEILKITKAEARAEGLEV